MRQEFDESRRYSSERMDVIAEGQVNKEAPTFYDFNTAMRISLSEGRPMYRYGVEDGKVKVTDRSIQLYTNGMIEVYDKNGKSTLSAYDIYESFWTVKDTPKELQEGYFNKMKRAVTDNTYPDKAEQYEPMPFDKATEMIAEHHIEMHNAILLNGNLMKGTKTLSIRKEDGAFVIREDGNTRPLSYTDTKLLWIL